MPLKKWAGTIALYRHFHTEVVFGIHSNYAAHEHFLLISVLNGTTKHKYCTVFIYQFIIHISNISQCFLKIADILLIVLWAPKLSNSILKRTLNPKNVGLGLHLATFELLCRFFSAILTAWKGKLDVCP